MRIVFILERLGNGGAERVTSTLAAELSNNYGHEVHVFTCVKENDEYELPPDVKRHVMTYGNSRFVTLKNKCEYLAKEVRKVKPDVVFSLATPRTTILLCLLSIGRKYTLIVSERNDPNKYPKSFVLKRLRNLAYRFSDGLVFQTEDAKKYFCYKIQKKGIVIPNPIVANLSKPFDGEREKRIVNFCRLEPQKNLKLLIDAMIRIHCKFPEYVLDIYGEGVQKKELEEYCINNKAEEYINFRGFDRDVHEKIINASLYVSSSDYEGISNSMLEAIAMGIPSICTDCPIGGARMVIENYENGILVPIRDVEKLAQAMTEVLENKMLAQKISLNGVKLRYKFSSENITKLWIDFAMERIKK